MTVTVMRSTAEALRKTKSMLPRRMNGDSSSNHLESEESKDSKSSDPGDKEEGNERDEKQD